MSKNLNECLYSTSVTLLPRTSEGVDYQNIAIKPARDVARQTHFDMPLYLEAALL